MHISICPNLSISVDKRALSNDMREAFIEAHPVLDHGFHAHKLHIFSIWTPEIIKACIASERSMIIDGAVKNANHYAQQFEDYEYDLTLILSTKTAYQADIVEALSRYLKSKAYSQQLMDVFGSVFQELLMNSIIHGNLALDVKLERHAPKETHFSKVAEIFSDISHRLEQEEFAQKAVIIGLNCHDHSLILSVQDEGGGFVFKDFVAKYDNAEIHKGMDLVFLMSKDLEYDFERKTMRVILEDQGRCLKATQVDKGKLARVGICTSSSSKYLFIQSILEEAGFKSVVYLEEACFSNLDLIRDIDLILFLSDINIEHVSQYCRDIRACYSMLDLPVLIQKSNDTTRQDIKALSAYVNDFMGAQVQVYELIARVGAHCSMRMTKLELLKFYNDYTFEIDQSSETIKRLETFRPVQIENIKGHLFDVYIAGSQTTSKNIAHFDFKVSGAYISYGQGFSLSNDKTKLFIYISMKDGLSPVLLFSYLRGYAEHYKEDLLLINVDHITNKIERFIKDIFPQEVDFKLICGKWEAGKDMLQLYQRGAFHMYEYDLTCPDIMPCLLFDRLSHGTDIGVQAYVPQAQKALLIYDANHEARCEELRGFLTSYFAVARSTGDRPRFHRGEVDVPYIIIEPVRA